MSPSRLILTPAVLLLAAHAALGDSCVRARQGPWRDEAALHETGTDSSRGLEGENRTPWPLTLRVEIREIRNAGTSRLAPHVFVIPPRSRLELLTVTRVDPDRAWGFSCEWWFTLGGPGARHDDSVRYRLPFPADPPRLLIQGVDDWPNHTGRERFAFDFEMPPGTPVLAAREGTVVFVRNLFSLGGAEPWLMPRANLVTVLHADGTFADYYHLDRDGILVRPGDEVSAGRPLARSGMTGFAAEPHLHFEVWKATWDARWETVPIRFDDGTPEGFVPEPGMLLPPPRPSEPPVPRTGPSPWARPRLP